MYLPLPVSEVLDSYSAQGAVASWVERFELQRVAGVGSNSARSKYGYINSTALLQSKRQMATTQLASQPQPQPLPSCSTTYGVLLTTYSIPASPQAVIPAIPVLSGHVDADAEACTIDTLFLQTFSRQEVEEVIEPHTRT